MKKVVLSLLLLVAPFFRGAYQYKKSVPSFLPVNKVDAIQFPGKPIVPTYSSWPLLVIKKKPILVLQNS